MQIMQLSLKEVEKSNKAVRTVIGAEQHSESPHYPASVSLVIDL